jgi:hypothetical protein
MFFLSSSDGFKSVIRDSAPVAAVQQSLVDTKRGEVRGLGCAAVIDRVFEESDGAVCEHDVRPTAVR